MSKFLFTTEDRKIHRNFIESQFDEPGVYARELVANALDSNTSRVEVQIGRGVFSVEDYGGGMTDEDLREYFLQLHSSKTKDRSNAIGEHGVGIHSVFRNNPYLVEVETSRGNDNIRFQIQRDLSLDVRQSGAKQNGTRVTVYKTKDSYLTDEVEAVANSPEEKVIRKYCKYHPTPIIVNGDQINVEVDIKSQHTLTLNSEYLQGEIGLDTEESDGRLGWLWGWLQTETGPEVDNLQVYNHWIYLEELEDNLFTGIVNSDRISPVVSRNAAKRDLEYSRFEEALKEKKVELIRRIYGSSQVPEDEEIHQYLLELIEEEDLDVGDLRPPLENDLRRKLLTFPLFGRNPGYSLFELYQQFQQTGEIVYTRFSIYRDKQFERRVVESVTNQELRLLRTIFNPTSVSQLGHSQRSPEPLPKKDRSGEATSRFGTLLRYFKSKSETLSGVNDRWVYLSNLGEQVSVPRHNFSLRVDFPVTPTKYLNRLGESMDRTRRFFRTGYRRLLSPVRKAGSSAVQSLNAGIANTKSMTRGATGRVLELGYPIPDSNYSDRERDLLSSLEQLTTSLWGESETSLNRIKLGWFWKRSKIAVPGNRFGDEDILYLNIRNPSVQRALRRRDLSNLYPLIPVILYAGTKNFATLHAQRRKVEKIEDCLDEMIVELKRH